MLARQTGRLAGWWLVGVVTLLLGTEPAALVRASGDDPVVFNYDPIKTDKGYQTFYAAVAYSPATGKYGYSHDWLAQVNARRVALKNCKADDARVLVVVGNGFCALALGDDRSAYGFGYAETDVEAKKIALRECRKRTTNCSIAVCVCSIGG